MVDESDDLQLELALRLDELAGVFRARRGDEPGLTPEAFAAEHDDVPAAALLAVLGGLGLMERTRTQQLGPFDTGERVGPYEVRGVIGRGGMGIVYDAVETGLGRRVALKALHGLQGGDRVRERFSREARAAAALEHPAIVPVYGSGETRGILWYAMRRVEGQALDRLQAALAPGQPEPVRRAARAQLEGSSSGSARSSSTPSTARLDPHCRAAAALALRLADALAYAHAHGVLHRDVKPANVLVDRAGHASLADFGLCKVEGDQTLTREGDIVGTLRYMPPEALEGRFDARGDVYGLGLVLHELVTGRPAFSAEDRHSMLHQVLHVEPPRLRALAPEAPADLERIVTKAISKVPEERYPGAAAFAEDLDALLTGKPVRARRPSPFYLLALFVRRNRALSATVLVAVLTLIVATSAYVLQLQGAYANVRDALDLAEENGARALMAAAEGGLRARDVVTARDQLEQVPAGHRGWMWDHLAARLGMDTTTEPTAVGDLEGMVASPDGEVLAVFGWGGIELRDRRGLGVVTRVDLDALDAAFVDDGATLLVLERLPRRLVRVAVPGGEVTPVGEVVAKAHAFEPVPGSTQVVLLVGLNGLEGFDCAPSVEDPGEAVGRLWRQGVPVPRVAAFVPVDASRVVLGTTGGQVLEVDVRGGPASELPAHMGAVTALLVEDGVLLASGAADGTLELAPALTGHGQVRVRLEDEVTTISRDGSRPHLLAVGTSGREVVLVDARTGSATVRARGLPTAPVAAHVGADPWLVTLGRGGTLARHGRGDHDGRIDLPPALGNVFDVGTSPDGRWVVTWCADGLVWVRDLRTGRVEFRPARGLGAASPAAFGPGGERFCLGPDLRALPAGDLLTSSPLPGSSHSAFLPDGTMVAVALHDWTLHRARLRGADRGVPGEFERLSPLNLDGVAGVVRLVQGAGALYLGTLSGDLLCLDAASLDLRWRRALGIEVCDVALDLAGDRLFVATVDGTVHAHAPATGEPREGVGWSASAGYSRRSTLSSLALGPAPGQVSTCTQDGRVIVWDANTGRRVGGLLEVGSEVRHLAGLGGSGWLVACGGGGRTLLLGSGPAPMAPEVLASAAPPVVTDVIERAAQDFELAVRVRGALQISARFRPGPWRTAALQRLQTVIDGQ